MPRVRHCEKTKEGSAVVARPIPRDIELSARRIRGFRGISSEVLRKHLLFAPPTSLAPSAPRSHHELKTSYLRRHPPRHEREKRDASAHTSRCPTDRGTRVLLLMWVYAGKRERPARHRFQDVTAAQLCVVQSPMLLYHQLWESYGARVAPERRRLVCLRNGGRKPPHLDGLLAT